MPRVQYASLNKNFSAGLIMLIEISSCACVALDNLNFCSESAAYPKIEMCSMLKYSQSLSIFKDDDCNIIFKTFWDMTTIGTDGMMSKVGYRVTSINIIINNKIREKVNDKKSCRLD